jgi:hypothetical protein
MTNKSNYFWVGYSDLMTSLFFIMLVLFVVAIGYLTNLQIGTLKENERLKKLLQIEKQFAPLENDPNFIYLKECRKFIIKDLVGIEIFNPTEVVIKPEFVTSTVNAGKRIEEFLKKLQETNPELSYLLVIEGNMANDWAQPVSKDDNWGYATSYKRALAVYHLWVQSDITFRKYNVEVLICGSGFNGLCRDEKEENNKRFSIQIIPKVQNVKE